MDQRVSDPGSALLRLLNWVGAIPEGMPPGETRYLTTLRIGMPQALAIHVLFLLAFALSGLEVLAWFNVASVALFAAATWSAWRHGMASSPLVMVCLLGEIPVHALLATLYLGLESMFLLFVLTSAVAVSFMPHLSDARRAVLLACVVVATVGIAAVSFAVPPLAPFDRLGTMILAVANVALATGVISLTLAVFSVAIREAESRAVSEYERAEALLRNILPEEVAMRLKEAPQVIADEHADATILFADIVDFTAQSSRLAPAELVDRLNAVFSAFDRLALKHGVEKIKTIGDAYMVVAGLPRPRPDHAQVIVRLAHDMLAELDRINEGLSEPIRLRIGINTGPVVAGVIGQTKFAYDLWGDAVNVASRLEEIAEPGQIRIGDATQAALNGAFPIVDLGEVELRGRGRLRTWSVAG